MNQRSMTEEGKYKILIFGIASSRYGAEIQMLNELLAQHSLSVYTPNGNYRDFVQHLNTFFASSDEQSLDGVIFLDHKIESTEIVARITYMAEVPSVIYEPNLENIRSFVDTIAGIHFDNDIGKKPVQRTRSPEETVTKLIQQIEQSRQNGRQ